MTLHSLVGSHRCCICLHVTNEPNGQNFLIQKMEGFDWSCEQASETQCSENDWFLKGEMRKRKSWKRGECSEINDIWKQKEEEGCMVRKIIMEWGKEGGKKEGGMKLWKGQFLLDCYHGPSHVWKGTWWRALCLVSCTGGVYLYARLHGVTLPSAAKIS